MLLLDESWNELLLISAIEHCFSAPGHDATFLPHLADRPQDDNISSSQAAKERDLLFIKKLIGRFEDLEMDAAEMGFLKAGVLYKPFVRGLQVLLLMVTLLISTRTYNYGEFLSTLLCIGSRGSSKVVG